MQLSTEKRDWAVDAVPGECRSGDVQIPFQLSRDVPGVQRILRKYGDREIDLAESCLIHFANGLRTGEVLTLDSDFEIYRWGRVQPVSASDPLAVHRQIEPTVNRGGVPLSNRLASNLQYLLRR